MRRTWQEDHFQEEAESFYARLHAQAVERMRLRAEAAGPVTCVPCARGGPLRDCVRPCDRPTRDRTEKVL